MDIYFVEFSMDIVLSQFKQFRPCVSWICVVRWYIQAFSLECVIDRHMPTW